MDRNWQPTATLDALRLRARLLADTRAFFGARGVLEVTTPVLGRSGPLDPHLSLVEARFPGAAGDVWYLQPSPESAMKRLLAAGSGPIYQIGPAFRAAEIGPRHNPEFTMLEWYRPGFDLDRLAGEVDALLGVLLGVGPGRRVRYRDLFREHTGIDPLEAPDAELATAAAAAGMHQAATLDRDALLDLLFCHRVEPALDDEVVHVTEFPASQAAMARVSGGVARRLEVYVRGVELANGYEELTDAGEQRRRFHAQDAQRAERGLPRPPMDEALLAALASGLPRSAGIALGFDRAVMLALGASDLEQAIAFPASRA